ncbi:uncharacterized protein ACNLHF_000987 [Anomaloglossus baeobatrachus]|uniref:uncharacterized protein LOC142250765 n=1 Tax=Anomaloglossus baeobatrachus TaxID=238106 RepID=UPI003F5037DD
MGAGKVDGVLDGGPGDEAQSPRPGGKVRRDPGLAERWNGSPSGARDWRLAELQRWWNIRRSHRQVEILKRRRRSCRDQYRREFNALPSTSKKRPYIYYRNLQFLRPVMELNQTDDNLDESESESATAGPSTRITSQSEADTQVEAETSQGNEPQVDADAGEGPSGAAVNTRQPAGQLASDSASQFPTQHVLPRPSVALVRTRRMQRSEEITSLPDLIDTRVLHILNSLNPETDAERFCRSLGPHLTLVPANRQVHVRAGILHLLEASQE